MSPERLEHLLSLVGPLITKKSCRSRDPISPGERLVLTLRYLASGDSQQSQSFNFRIGRSTVCAIIKETCDAIWTALKDLYVKPPQKEEDWKQIAEEFEEEWNFPHCLRAIDGKHICIDCPQNSGSTFFNYKNYHSVVLMACVDAKYCFTFVDIGNYGRDNDAAIFSQTEFAMGFEAGNFPVPEPSSVGGYALPYVLVGDDIFPLKMWLMKPFPGKSQTEVQAIYNYRLSRCRRIVENSFGIMVARWRIFRRPIRANVETVDSLVQACVSLRNYLQLTDNAHYVPRGFIDSEDSTGTLIHGEWRSTVSHDEGALQPLRRVGSNSYPYTAKSVRDSFAAYFNSKEGSLPWQLNHVRNCGRTINE